MQKKGQQLVVGFVIIERKLPADLPRSSPPPQQAAKSLDDDVKLSPPLNEHHANVAKVTNEQIENKECALNINDGQCR